MPLVDHGYVTKLSYSPLLGGFSIVLNDGRAAFLVAATLKFDPNSVQVFDICPHLFFIYSMSIYRRVSDGME